MDTEDDTALRREPGDRSTVSGDADGDGGPTGGDGARVGEVAVELRALLSLRSRTSARDRHLPALSALIPRRSRQDPDARFAAITNLVERGIQAMPDADHATAAGVLLGPGSGRWRPLAARGPEAAAPFGCGWDAYRRRRRSTDTSLLEETVDLLARTIVGLSDEPADEPMDLAPTRAPEPLVTIGPSIEHQDGSESDERRDPGGTGGALTPKRARSRRTLAGAAAALAVAILVAGAAAFASGLLVEDDAPQVSCGSLDQEVGATPAGAEPDLVAWSEPFTGFVTGMGMEDIVRCASHITRWEHGAIQRLGTGDPSLMTALIGSEKDGQMVVVHLTWSELRAFGTGTSASGPAGGSRLGETLGPVLGRHEGPGGERVVEFEDGLFVTAPTDAPTFAIAGAWVDIWNESGAIGGDLGLPLTNRITDPSTGELFQQFERGTISTASDGQVQVVSGQDHYPMSLPDDPRDQVLVADPPGHWWYVDAEGVRHYVSTAENQKCLQKTMGVPILRSQHVAAIASLPAGGQFRCD